MGLCCLLVPPLVGPLALVLVLMLLHVLVGVWALAILLPGVMLLVVTVIGIVMPLPVPVPMLPMRPMPMVVPLNHHPPIALVPATCPSVLPGVHQDSPVRVHHLLLLLPQGMRRHAPHGRLPGNKCSACRGHHACSLGKGCRGCTRRTHDEDLRPCCMGREQREGEQGLRGVPWNGASAWEAWHTRGVGAVGARGGEGEAGRGRGRRCARGWQRLRECTGHKLGRRCVQSPPTGRALQSILARSPCLVPCLDPCFAVACLALAGTLGLAPTCLVQLQISCRRCFGRRLPPGPLSRRPFVWLTIDSCAFSPAATAGGRGGATHTPLCLPRPWACAIAHLTLNRTAGTLCIRGSSRGCSGCRCTGARRRGLRSANGGTAALPRLRLGFRFCIRSRSR